MCAQCARKAERAVASTRSVYCTRMHKECTDSDQCSKLLLMQTAPTPARTQPLSTHKGSISRIFKGAEVVCREQTEPGRASARPQGVLPDLLTQD